MTSVQDLFGNNLNVPLVKSIITHFYNHENKENPVLIRNEECVCPQVCVCVQAH